MIAIGNYFLFFMSVIGTIFAVPEITPENEEKFFEIILNVHNRYRDIYGLQSLALSPDGIPEAQRILDSLVNYWYVDYSKTYGSNFFMEDLTEYSELNDELANKIVADWCNTENDYDYNEEPSSSFIDSFLQIVWPNTTQISLAMQVKGDILHLIVVYFPKVNWEKEYRKTVPRTINTTDSNCLDTC